MLEGHVEEERLLLLDTRGHEGLGFVHVALGEAGEVDWLLDDGGVAGWGVLGGEL